MRRISILMYHQVGEFAPMRGHRSTYCHHRRFVAQMAYLHRFRYRVLSMDEVLAAVRGERPIPPRAVAITFDDGYENFYQYALPALRRYRFPATVYCLSGLLGQDAEWFAADGRETPRLMSAARLRELRGEGVTIGSHGVSHVRLARVDRERMADEVRRSKAELEAVLDAEVRHFCYPYGSHDAEVVETARAAGYATAVTCVRAGAAPGDDPLALPRKAISYGDNLAGVFWKLHMKNRPKA